ncbi:MAG: tRNA (adenosine(37)-N6)-threonylcarbamoyltransferase complex dimerization subunit type 1 TsaB [Balneolaceae bacterium]
MLAIETSTDICSVAIINQTGRVFEKRTSGPGVHSEYTVQFVQELMERLPITWDELDGVLFSGGPGSYTGLRIGASAIKGMLFGRDIPLYTFPTLLSFLFGFNPLPATGTFHGVLDARRTHVYMQTCELADHAVISTTPPEILDLSEAEERIKPQHYIAGTGLERLSLPVMKDENRRGVDHISARNLLLAWNHPAFRGYFTEVDPAGFTPHYVTMAQVNNTQL